MKQLREQHGYTQDALAFEAGIGRRTIQQIEAGEQAVTVDLLFSLARAFSLQPVDLFKGFAIQIEE